MRVASRLGGEDLESGKGCIGYVGRLRWEGAGNGGSFSIRRPWPVPESGSVCVDDEMNKTKSNSRTNRTRDPHVTRDTCDHHTLSSAYLDLNLMFQDILSILTL
jgi:hypothetical protein